MHAFPVRSRFSGGSGRVGWGICLANKALSLGGEGSELSGIGAARTASCVRKQVASRRYLMINIWRGSSGLKTSLTILFLSMSSYT